MESYISKEIKKGDLILVIFNNTSELGFYLGKGRNQSHQYHRLTSLDYWLPEIKQGIAKAPAKGYVSNCTPYRMVKYSPELLNDEFKDKYNNALEALKLLNF